MGDGGPKTRPPTAGPPPRRIVRWPKRGRVGSKGEKRTRTGAIDKRTCIYDAQEKCAHFFLGYILKNRDGENGAGHHAHGLLAMCKR